MSIRDWSRSDTIAIGKILADRWVIRCEDEPSSIPWYRWPHDVWKELQNSSKKELPEQPKLAYDEEPTEDISRLKFELPKSMQKVGLAVREEPENGFRNTSQ